ncbi:glycosyltransferase family 4 protein [Mastigocoleus sp. MO_188.B34]|uniref:glycosyltransferase family 4 protein n=1 Tax=Mastigocoleus sp. MO_188.B34 TaxID=3036635 RepID=UPI0026360002|nr:glycosyltransferase family 4 protein [Mastigocoleus sp. MO_188.B34]MDJ0696296.1 glycosyltransferase family 4 protein [Mastigocoleus sp. MO_188.B34]
MKTKVIFCWSDISGYMAACWQTLNNLPDIDVFVIAFKSNTETAFSDQLMQDIPCQLLDLQERQDATLIKHLVLRERPDVLVLCGWLHKPYCQLAFASELHEVVKVMGMDTPWWGTLKQYLAPFVLRPYLQQISRVVVAGERSWQYARCLGVKTTNIMRGLYGVDFNALSPLYVKRVENYWPRSFLFVGRYAQVKALDLLTQAYKLYREKVSKPWNLICCGKGPLASQLEGKPGIDNQGFVQPAQMQDIWQSAGAFILPSRFDPWPLALVEAAAAGLPIICTDVCGSAVEMIRPYYNGLMIPSEDPEALAKALLCIQQYYEELPVWGKRSQELATAYGADIWARRWQEMINEIGRTLPTKQNQSLITADSII